MREQRGGALRGAVRVMVVGAAAAAAAQAALAGPPPLRSEGGLLVLPNVRVESAAQPLELRGAAMQAGMKAYKDHATGKLRKATPEELLQEAAAAPPSNDTAAARVTVLPGGQLAAELDETFLSYSVVRRDAKGALDMQCVTGEAAAHRALAPKAAGKEARHAH